MPSGRFIFYSAAVALLVVMGVKHYEARKGQG